MDIEESTMIEGVDASLVKSPLGVKSDTSIGCAAPLIASSCPWSGVHTLEFNLGLIQFRPITLSMADTSFVTCPVGLLLHSIYEREEHAPLRREHFNTSINKLGSTRTAPEPQQINVDTINNKLILNNDGGDIITSYSWRKGLSAEFLNKIRIFDAELVWCIWRLRSSSIDTIPLATIYAKSGHAHSIGGLFLYCSPWGPH